MLHSGTEMAQLICGGCHTLLMYVRGATSVHCSCCHTINLAMEGFIFSNLIIQFNLYWDIIWYIGTSEWNVQYLITAKWWNCWLYSVLFSSQPNGSYYLWGLLCHFNVSIWCSISKMCCLSVSQRNWGMFFFLYSFSVNDFNYCYDFII